MADKGKDVPKVPGHITKHVKQYGHAKKLVDTASITHLKAYVDAADSHLMGKDGLHDYNLLEDTKIQEKFSQSMIDMYQKSAIAYFKTAKDLDEFQKDMLMNAYLGTTSDQIRKLVSENGKDFTLSAFKNYQRNIEDALSKRLYTAADSHLNDEHVKDLFSASKKKFSGLENLVDGSKLDASEAAELHRLAIDGNLNERTIKSVVPSYKRKKEKKEDKK